MKIEVSEKRGKIMHSPSFLQLPLQFIALSNLLQILFPLSKWHALETESRLVVNSCFFRYYSNSEPSSTVGRAPSLIKVGLRNFATKAHSL